MDRRGLPSLTGQSEMIPLTTRNATPSRASSEFMFAAIEVTSHCFAALLSSPRITILAVTIFVGQASIVKPLATATFCAPFAV